MSGTLTAKQLAFCLAYTETENASEAYRRAYNVKAGTAANTVYVEASKLLKNPKIAQRLQELQAEAVAQAVVSKTWIIERLARNAQMCLGEIPVVVDRVNKDGEKVTVEIRKHDPAGAARSLELLGKELAMFVDRSENKHVVSHEDMLDMLDKVEAVTNESRRPSDLN